MISVSTSRVFPVLLIIMECGVLYSLSLVVMLVTYLSASNSAYIVIDMVHILQSETRRSPHADTTSDWPNHSNYILPDHISDSNAAVR